MKEPVELPFAGQTAKNPSGTIMHNLKVEGTWWGDAEGVSHLGRIQEGSGDGLPREWPPPWKTGT